MCAKNRRPAASSVNSNRRRAGMQILSITTYNVQNIVDRLRIGLNIIVVSNVTDWTKRG